MNLTYRKLAMLEKDFIAKEEAAKIEGFYSVEEKEKLFEKIKENIWNVVVSISKIS